jgi:hypothetical protein
MDEWAKAYWDRVVGVDELHKAPKAPIYRAPYSLRMVHGKTKYLII